MTIWHLDPSTVGGVSDGSQPLDFLLMRSPDGTVWKVSVTDSGTWAGHLATEDVPPTVLLTEAGGGLLTEDGMPLLVEV
jgi:hypothetical protein